MRKINKILTTTLALPIAVLPAISVASCNKNQEVTETLTVYGKETVDEKDSGVQYLAFNKDWTILEVTWSVDNTAVATISETGILKPVAKGKVKVTATTKDTKEFGTFDVVVADSWAEFKDTWATYDANFQTLGEKYKTATINPDHNKFLDETINSGSIEYNIKIKQARAGLILHGNKDIKVGMLCPYIDVIEKSIKSFIEKELVVELVNNKTDGIIGYKVYEQDTIVETTIWDSNLYLRQYYLYTTATQKTKIDLIVTQYNE